LNSRRGERPVELAHPVLALGFTDQRQTLNISVLMRREFRVLPLCPSRPAMEFMNGQEQADFAMCFDQSIHRWHQGS